MPAIYRDYRPQKFNDILGQNHLKITLQNELAEASLSHAYLFCGPRAVGKTSMARVLAQAVNCQKRKEGESEPCGECPACLSIKKGNALDVMEIDAASNTGVDNVRDNIIASARLAPSNLKMKVFIIDEVHMLSLSAFNALLKIVEEPPSHILFILCTTEIHKVPLTIISRCQRFDFKRISPVEIVKKLKLIATTEKVEVDKEVLENIAKHSGGHLRDAESLFGQVLALGEKKIDLETAALVLPRHHQNEALEVIAALAKQDAGKAISIINDLSDYGVNFKIFLEELLLLLRKIMLQSLQPGLAEKLGLDLGEQLELKLSKLSQDLNLAVTLKILKRFLLLLKESNFMFDQLPFEIAIAELCLRPVSDNKPALSSSAPLISRAEIKQTPSTNNEPIKTETDAEIKTVAPDLSAEEVSSRWPEVLLKIKKHNHSLSFVLQNCLPAALKNGVMVLHFKYKFHRDRIISANIKSLTEDTLAEVFLGRVQIEAILDEKLELSDPASQSEKIDTNNDSGLESKEKKTESSGVLGNLLANFGGEAL